MVSVPCLLALMDEPSRSAFIIQQESKAIMQDTKQLARRSVFSTNAISANFHENKSRAEARLIFKISVSMRDSKVSTREYCYVLSME